MKDLIENLQEFAKLDFPVHKVTSYLKQYQLLEKDKFFGKRVSQNYGKLIFT